MLGWGQFLPLQIDTSQFLKFKQRYVSMISNVNNNNNNDNNNNNNNNDKEYY